MQAIGGHGKIREGQRGNSYAGFVVIDAGFRDADKSGPGRPEGGRVVLVRPARAHARW